MRIRRVAVLGAGVMGAQIAAHFVNAGLDVMVFDLPSPTGSPNQLVERSIQALKKLKPAPLAIPQLAARIKAANYESDMAQLSQCDLVIEAISERLDWKSDLFHKVAPHLGPKAVLASNTSGLSIAAMADTLPAAVRNRFCGIHFFNPPRYMKLVELVAGPQTEPQLLDDLETFLVSTMGKGVVRAKDTPNFVGNRIGVFSMVSSLRHAEALHLPPDVVDLLTGNRIGRAKSATYRTMDVVGLDTLQHVVQTMADELKDDPWAAWFTLPGWVTSLIERGALGQKVRKGVYQKSKEGLMVLDTKTLDYRPSKVDPSTDFPVEIGKESWPEALLLCRESDNPKAQFLWRVHRDLFHYAALHLADIAETVRDVDQAIRWGFGWSEGPFELWQRAGWSAIAAAIQEDIERADDAISTPLPDWVTTVSGVYNENKAYSVGQKITVPRRCLPVYEQFLAPQKLLGDCWQHHEIITENPETVLWQTPHAVPILSFTSKRNCIGQGVVDGVMNAVEHAESIGKPLVIYPLYGNDFSVGANLKQFGQALSVKDIDTFRKSVQSFQAMVQRVKYATVPVVACIKGLALGGGVELSLPCHHRVAAFESYMGLVETGVGLIPAGGGSTQVARWIHEQPSLAGKRHALGQYFMQLAQGKVSASALEAMSMGYLQRSDTVVMNEELLLTAAIQRGLSLQQAHRTPTHEPFSVMGQEGLALLLSQITNMKQGHLISEHDALVAEKLAYVVCGGDVAVGSIVDEQWMLSLELDAFVALAETTKTQDRIQHTLKYGKPLRN